jgi:hypothetical protein
VNEIRPVLLSAAPSKSVRVTIWGAKRVIKRSSKSMSCLAFAGPRLRSDWHGISSFLGWPLNGALSFCGSQRDARGFFCFFFCFQQSRENFAIILLNTLISLKRNRYVKTKVIIFYKEQHLLFNNAEKQLFGANELHRSLH